MTYQPDETPDEPAPDYEEPAEVEQTEEEPDEAPVQPEYYYQPDPTAEELRGLKSALAEERRRNRDLAENQRREVAERAVLNERLTQLDQAVRRSQEPKPAPAPDRDQDPVGWMSHQVEQHNRMLQGLGQYVQHREQATQQQQRQQQFMQRVQGLEIEFVQQYPDYHQALTHLRQELIGDLTSAGYSPQQAVQHVHQQELAAAWNAMSLGENPAARLYALAQRRGYGYTDAEAYENGNGQAQQQAWQPDVAQAFQQAMQGPDLSVQAAGGQEAATLGSAGGGSGGRMPSLKGLAAMSKEEFAEATKGDNWKRLWT